MRDRLQELDVVALTQDVPGSGLVRGQVGTIVFVHDSDHFEVEFVDGGGFTYALLPLDCTQLLLLHFRPDRAA